MSNRQNTFLFKRSNTPGKKPLGSDLQLGEIALNTADVILYTSGTTANQILPIGWDRISRTGDTVTGDFVFNGGITATTISATTYLNYPTVGGGGDYLPLSGGTVTGDTTFTTNVQINNNLDVVSIDPVDYVQFYTGATQSGAVGRFIWNNVDGTLDLGLKGGNVTLQLGQKQVVRVVNKTSPLVDLLEANYQAVVVAGATGQRLSVRLAQADSDLNSAATIGLVTETILKNQEGFVTTSGKIHDINTTGSLQGETWNDGDVLYLSPTTAGAITNVKPVAPQHTIIVGYVEYKHAVHGKIFVKVDNGYELDELHNVKITSAISGDQLIYNGSTSLWENTHPYWTIDLMDNSNVSFYTVENIIISSITNVVGSPTITIADDGVAYTLGNTIAIGSKITVSSNISSVIKLNLIK